MCILRLTFNEQYIFMIFDYLRDIGKISTLKIPDQVGNDRTDKYVLS